MTVSVYIPPPIPPSDAGSGGQIPGVSVIRTYFKLVDVVSETCYFALKKKDLLTFTYGSCP